MGIIVSSGGKVYFLLRQNGPRNIAVCDDDRS